MRRPRLRVVITTTKAEATPSAAYRYTGAIGSMEVP